MSNESQDYIAKEFFKSRILESDATKFEDLFMNLMHQVYPNEFQQVKPYGNIGDKKNDGYLKSKGVYFQVYGPEKVDKPDSIRNAIKKVNEDLEGLLAYWNDIGEVREWYFVINDKFKGCDPNIHEAISDLEKKHKTIKLGLKTSNNLLEDFRCLEFDRKESILGYIPDEKIKVVSLDVISKVINHVLDNFEIIDGINSNRLKVPNVGEKMKINGIEGIVATILLNAMYQQGIIDKYYVSNPEDKSVLQKKVISSFHKKTKDGKADSNLMLKMRDEMIPNREAYNNASRNYQKSISDAIWVVLGYFFEICDLGTPPSEKSK